jgi:hypothetical protein
LAVAFPAHTTNIFHALDYVLFDALKKLKTPADGEFDDNSVNDQIANLVQVYEQTATSTRITITITIRSSFRRARMVSDTSVRHFRLSLNKGSLQENSDFKEI